MAPYLETVTSFSDVPISSDGIDTVTFLKASEGLVGLFDLLGSAAFTAVQADLKGNIVKVRTRYDATPELSDTLQKLVKNEQGEKKRTATEGLMWLVRGLSFTCKGLMKAQEDKKQELSVAFGKSYEETLKQYHNFVVKGVFSVAMKACPYRADFYKKLAADPDGGVSMQEVKLDDDLNKWLAALAAIIQIIQDFYAKEVDTTKF